MEQSGTTTSTQEPAPPPRERQTFRNVAIAAVVVIVLGLVGLAIWGMATHPSATGVLRDISIIVLALVTIVIGLFLVILIFQLQSLIALLRDEVKPILESANQTASTVRGTTTFVSDSVVKPMIGAASFAAGVGRTIRVLTGSDHKKQQRSRSRGSGQG